MSRGKEAQADYDPQGEYTCPLCGGRNALKYGAYRGPYGHFCRAASTTGRDASYEGWWVCADCWEAEWWLEHGWTDETELLIALLYARMPAKEICRRMGWKRADLAHRKAELLENREELTAWANAHIEPGRKPMKKI